MWWVCTAWAATDPPVRSVGEGGRARLWAQAGWDPTAVVEVGGAAPVARGRIGVDLGGYVGAAPSLVLAGRPSLGAGAGAEVGVGEGRWRFTSTAYATARSASDAAGGWLALGTTVAARATWNPSRFTLGPEVAWAAAWATWHDPSSGVDALYGDRPGAAVNAPHTGFYAATSHRVRGGLCAAVDLSGRVALSTGMGIAWTPHALGRITDVPVVPPPFYGELAIGVRR